MRPISKDDAVYAAKVGVSPKTIRNLGGAEKLRNLAPHVRKVLLGEHYYGNGRTIHRGGITARGMKSGRSGQPVPWNSQVENAIQAALRERGLVKE